MKYNNFCKSITKVDVIGKTDDILFSIKKGAFKDEEKEQIRKYCKCNINNISYSKDEEQIYNYYLLNIMRNLHFDGLVEEDDIRVITQYLVVKKIKEMNLNVYFKILPGYLYALKYGIRSVSSCLSKPDGSSIIFFRDSLFKMALDKDGTLNKENFFWLLDNIFHEIAHAHQNHIMYNCHEIDNKKVLIWIKENIIDSYDRLYYHWNYQNMHIERDANIEGRDMTLDCLNTYFKYFGIKFLKQLEYDTLDYCHDTKYLKHYSPNASYRMDADAVDVIDEYIDKIALKHPVDIYKKLSIQYNCDGQRRSSKLLSDEYWIKRSLLAKNYNSSSIIYNKKLNDLNELYDYLINSAKEYESYYALEKEKRKSLKNRF